MAEYEVIWSCDITADSPEEAAKEALDYILNTDARVFGITNNKTKERTIVDLSTYDEPAQTPSNQLELDL